ncbi:cyanobactin maturation protease, PatA/PatG family [Cylindrospermum stagnale PCC 7417]|uniref:Cyanobactin maturation protease, PatA/PatG family n=2 Tax=Cylindrospermum stagnale TaxID=142864 RepID=K9WUJ6_9NOST|nr:cyanobactin maturation protease, PatA/PatG family [Cylindrospermum stagnale PCC 7417]
MGYGVSQITAEVAGFSDITALPGLQSLWAESLGNPRICVAVLDGLVDQSHPCFDGAQFTRLPTLVSGVADQGTASQHGTHVTSVIFGQHGSPIRGIAPGCRGLIVPVFTNGSQGGVTPCSQIDLARAITQAVEQGANVINISGGQLAASSESDKLLANAVRLCADNNVLIVAAAGNDGCDCLHVPAALESVLAVGAMDFSGNPIGFSNWGEVYRSQGILAPGENILGAIPGGGTATRSGTSFATPIVSGLVALLLSIQLQRGQKPDPHAIRDAILKTALPCNLQKSLDSRRCLVGSLNIAGVEALIKKEGIQQMSNQEEVMIQPSEVNNIEQEVINQLTEPVMQIPNLQESSYSIPMMNLQPASANVVPSSVAPSECTTCAENANSENAKKTPAIQIVYALGTLGIDYSTEARRDSFIQAIPPGSSLSDYLDQNPYEAQSLIWTLSLDATPIYAIFPMGAYATFGYDRLRQILAEGDSVERISVPGRITGSIKLMSGQTVPVLVPELRGIYSWTIPALMDSLVAAYPAQTRENLTAKVREYLERIYYEYRNLGVTPQERALNFSATNAFQVTQVLASAVDSQLGLNSIGVTKSPICRAGSDCYDVTLQFFNLEDSRRSGKVYRFTVDVSEVIPVTIGSVRSWSVSS